MTELLFDRDTLSRVKNKQGVYRELSKPIIKPKAQTRISTVIMEAFKEYAIKRGCKPDMLSKESQLFKSILEQYL